MQAFIAVFCLLGVASASQYGPAQGNQGWAQQGQYGHHVPVISDGVPIETPEVQQAKAAHAQAYAQAQSLAGRSQGYAQPDPWSNPAPAPSQWAPAPQQNSASWGNSGRAQASWGPPPEIANGVPVETAEVQHAKAAHFKAVAAAQALEASLGPNSHDPYASPPQSAPQWSAPQQAAPQWSAPQQAAPQWSAPQQAAPQWSAPQQAAPQWGAPSYGAPSGGEGLPLDTPEVAQAKAAHLAAHAQASARSSPHPQPAW